MRKQFRFNVKEFIWILVLPIAISIMYFFFQNYKKQLALNRNDIHFWQIYTKDLINDSLNHYFSISFGVIIGGLFAWKWRLK